jgi:hypothetical protein
MFDKLQKYAPMTLLTLALPFTAAAADGKKCDVSLAVESPIGNKEVWDTKAVVEDAAAKQDVALKVLVYPGAPHVKIVRNGQPGENFSISEFSDAGKKATQECLNGGAQAVTVSTPDLSR